MEPNSAVFSHLHPRLAIGLCCGLSGLLAACGGSDDTVAFDPGTTVGQAVENPATGRFFFVDPNERGLSQTPKVLRLAWGRLVRVNWRDQTGATKEMNTDFVISQDLVSDGFNYELFTSAVTNEQTLTILTNAPVDSEQGRNEFHDLLRQAEANLAPIFDNGTSGGGAGFFSMVPRNAAIVVQIDDLIAAQTIDATTIRTVTGIPTLIPFQGRILADQNHGDLADFNDDGLGEFYTTRVIVDTTVSELESFGTDPPLLVNPVGLPPSLDMNQSNLQVRIPTVIDETVGQERVLINPSNHALTTINNGTVDFTSPTLDVVRAMRSGGPSGVTQDPFNGFMRDEIPPSVVGRLQMTIDVNPCANETNPPPSCFPFEPGDDEQDFWLPSISFQSVFCAQTPAVGDIISQTNLFAVVTQVTEPVANGTVQNVKVRLLVWPSGWFGPLQWKDSGIGPGEFLSGWDAQADVGKQACFVQVFPLANGFPEDPTDRIFTSATFGVRFSEPMDSSSLTAFDSMLLTRQATPESTTDYVAGSIQESQTQDQYVFVPDLALAHETGGTESYYLTLSATPSFAATDLAGNVQGSALPTVEATIEPSAAPQTNGGRVSRFSSADEDPPFGMPGDPPLSEWSGQHTYNLTAQFIRPRPVVRFQNLADRSQAMVAQMSAAPSGVQSPVSNYGSKTHALWRYVDLGFDLINPADYNLDVEGLAWAPFGGDVVVDNYDTFEMLLSHSFFFPDEVIDTLTQLPIFPNSGLDGVFGTNPMNLGEDPQKIVNDRHLGYQIHPGDIFVVGQNVSMIPFPMNTNIPPELFRYYTWRDTSLLTRAGPNSFGAPPLQFFVVFGLPVPIDGNCMMGPTPNPWYDPNQIQSVGLPLLMEFRCFQEDGANGVNKFDVSMAVNASTRPFFRAFSEGGIDTSSNPVFVDPDLEQEANGGFNPLSMPVPGAPTFGRDGLFYIGAMDLVVRVSRSFTLWQQTTNPLGSPPVFVNPSYFPATLEPRQADQPPGTGLEVAFRGATTIVADSEPLINATELDAYGDHYTEVPSPCDGSIDHNPATMNTDITFLNNDARWFDDVSAIDGAQYYQARVTFISNTVSGQSPILSAFALTWTD